MEFETVDSPHAKTHGQKQGSQHHNTDIPMSSSTPFLWREQLPPHMLCFLVGFRHQFLHQFKLTLFMAFYFFGLTTQTYNLRTIVFLGLVLHLVVHSRLLLLQCSFRETNGIYQLRHRQLRQFLQRIENVHHLQVLARRIIQVLHVGTFLRGHRVMIGFPLLHSTTQRRQFFYQYQLGQRQQ